MLYTVYLSFFYSIITLNLEEEETSDDGQEESKNGSKGWAAEEETNFDVGEGFVGLLSVVEKEGVKTALWDSEETDSGVAVNGQELGGFLEEGEGVEVPDLVFVWDRWGGGDISYDDSEVWAIWEDAG